MFDRLSKEEREEMLARGKQELSKRIDLFMKTQAKYVGIFRNVPKPYRKLWLDAFEGKLSGVRLQKLKCLDCSGWDRNEVRDCTVRTCPLWAKRPYK